jgi:hypothetical protein
MPWKIIIIAVRNPDKNPTNETTTKSDSPSKKKKTFY